MERDPRARQKPVKLCMDVEGGGFGSAITVNDVAVEIADQQVRCFQFAERVAIGVHDEQVIVTGQQRREMVADAFLEPEAGSHPEAGRQVFLGLPDRIAGEIRVVVPEARIRGTGRVGKRMGHGSGLLYLRLPCHCQQRATGESPMWARHTSAPVAVQPQALSS